MSDPKKKQSSGSLGTGTMPSSSENITSIIVNDARNVFEEKQKQRSRNKAMFFRVVMGGATTVATDVLNVVQNLSKHQGNNSNSRQYEELYRWLLGCPITTDQDAQTCESNFTEVKTSSRGLILLKLLILVPLWIILTPLFYTFHSLCHGFLNSQNVLADYCLSHYHKLEFPLAFAVFSGEKDMVELFLRHKVAINVKDAKGNNVMHYLADLSAYDVSKALRCYKILRNLADEGIIENKILHDMILEEENVHKQNALEYCYQFGGLKLGSQMLHDTMTIHEMVIADKQVTLAPSLFTQSNCNLQDLENENEARNENQQKSGDNPRISERSLPASSVETLENRWGVKKLMITRYANTSRHGFMSLILHLFNSRPTTAVSKENWEDIQNDQGIQKWITYKFKQWKWPIGAVMIIEYVVMFSMFGFLLNSEGDMFLEPNKKVFVTNHVQTFLTNWQKNDSSTAGIDTTFRSSFFAAYSDLEQSLSQDKNSMDYTEMLGLIRKLNGYEDYSLSNLTDLYNQLCINGSVYQQVGDLVYMDNCTIPAANALLEDCYYIDSRYTYYFLEEHWDPYEFVMVSSFQTGIFIHRNSIFKNLFRFSVSTWFAHLLIFGLIAYFCIYLALDIYCRLAILAGQIANNVTLYAILATPLPGSYIRGQCKVFTSCAFILLTTYYLSDLLKIYEKGEPTYLKSEILSFDSSTDDNIRNSFFLSNVIVFMLVARIILHLFSFRLFPVIGNFVITTFEMATDLFQFIIIYVLIVVIFSGLFFWFSRSATCPFRRDDNYKDYWIGMFSTFAATFGHVDLNFDSLGIKIVYLVFVVMSILLLLNLIIAVMSSTAAEVTVDPWKTQLYQEALCSEAFGIEHWICSIFGYRKDLIEWTLKRASFEICKSVDDEEKCRNEIYIEYFEATQ